MLLRRWLVSSLFTVLLLAYFHGTIVAQQRGGWLRGQSETQPSKRLIHSQSGTGVNWLRGQTEPRWLGATSHANMIADNVSLGNNWEELQEPDSDADKQDLDSDMQDEEPLVRDLGTARYEISLLSRPLSEIDVDIRDLSADHPQNQSNELLTSGFGGVFPRYFETRTVCWQSANIGYQNLYFEDVLAERYGQTTCQYFQPYVSAAHFFASAALLPINLRLEEPQCCDYPLGYCLPGNCTPPLRQRILLD